MSCNETIVSCSVTSDSMVGGGVFVNSEGQLDVSEIEQSGNVLYACVGVDDAGNTARTRIRVITVDPEEGE